MHLKNTCKQKLRLLCDSFYNLELLKNDDDSSKIQEMWAFHLPAVLLINGPEYWPTLKPIYESLSHEVSSQVQLSLAGGFLEIARLNFDESFLTQKLMQFVQSDLDSIQ